jgi:hypothetical protein
MSFSDPGSLVSGFVISTIGLALFMHGKKVQRLRNLGLGLAMMVFPIFVHSLVLMWAIACACIVGAFVLPDGS